MAGTEVTQQSPVPLRWANQIQETRDEDATKEVVPEEEFIKDVAEDAEDSTTPHTHNQSVTSMEKWNILVQF